MVVTPLQVEMAANGNLGVCTALLVVSQTLGESQQTDVLEQNGGTYRQSIYVRL
jgi:hypothetical protein